ncbi:MAG: hypothetical protein LBQ60_18205 [Bacteroidales bacterium]|jgi:ATP-dependent DNA helicase RecG|nr:hypothetical protein [Bacteroidales bacterium]
MEQIEKATDLLTTKYITYAISYDGFSRKETPTFPLAAIRETFLNAIAHKDYFDPTPIQISVYPDRFVCWNAGHLPEKWTLNTLLQKHPSHPYNPDIANSLFRCGDIEAWGRGFRKIIRSTLDEKLLPPRIEYLSGIMLTFYADVRTQLAAEGLSEGLIPIIEYVITNGRINNSQIQTLVKVSKTTATRILWQLEPWVTKQGITGKGTYYTLKGNDGGIAKNVE